jgi:hypothetical protein
MDICTLGVVHKRFERIGWSWRILVHWPCMISRSGLCLELIHVFFVHIVLTLEGSLSIKTGRCDLAIATHARKMHKNLFVVVHPEVLDND